MSDNSFRKSLRAFAAAQIGQPGEHKRQELADAFLDQYPELAREYMRDMASKHVAGLIKDLCDESGPDPLPLFAGFPAAIATAPGVVKATANCTLDDLGAGLSYREQNVRNARERLEAYGRSMEAFVSLRTGENETVGECSERLRKQGPVST